MNFRSNGDIYSDEFTDITSWTDDDFPLAESSQVTFDGKSCLKLYSGVGTGSNHIAARKKDVGTFPARTVISFSIYVAASSDTVSNSPRIDFHDGSTNAAFELRTNGIFVYDGATFNEADNVTNPASWQEWTFDINFTAQTVDIYLDGVLKASGIDCSYGDPTANGTIYLSIQGFDTAERDAYIDWIKVGTNFEGLWNLLTVDLKI